MRSFRSKPVGWRGDSYRHYLAGKGINTTTKDTFLGGLASRYLEETSLDAEANRQKAVAQGTVPYKVAQQRAFESTRGPLSSDELSAMQSRLNELGKRRMSSPPWFEFDDDTWKAILSKEVERTGNAVKSAQQQETELKKLLNESADELSVDPSNAELKKKFDAQSQAVLQASTDVKRAQELRDATITAQREHADYVQTARPNFSPVATSRMKTLLATYRGSEQRPVFVVAQEVPQ